jgi:hypothetical protein
MEDDDVRRAPPDAERMQGPLARLVRRLSWNRKALVPTLRDLAGREAAEEGQHEPGADDCPAVTSDEMSETGKQAVLLSPYVRTVAETYRH